MSLVAYSDDDCSEDECEESVENEQSKSEQKSSLKTLPTPKARMTPSLNDFILRKDLKGSVKIAIPDLPDFEEEVDENEEQKQKRQRLHQSSSGSGLLSLLPSPGSNKKDKQLTLIPQSVSKTKPKPIQTFPKKPIKLVQSVEDDDDIVGEDNSDFFSLTSEVKAESRVNEKSLASFSLSEENEKEEISEASSVDIAPTLPEISAPDTSLYSTHVTETHSHTINHTDVNDPSFKRLIAQKFGEEPPEAIKVIDVNASQFINQNRDYLKTISQEKPEEFTGIVPSSTAKRKHQITYLAYQAKQRELQLKNEWATSKLTKSQTRAKYGF
ncbi:proline-rich protein PRCC-like protein [Dinothrombium tinctorium]|uniref:Proline-rich protein PRCC-like protein n=1 Tax=Dinothrombium tinctorium TaxID=1965070 RepID=A0A443QWU8_9ACAR|nr:proline-rich protein PRCC-like protein [Dinothrombium tinctorium]